MRGLRARAAPRRAEKFGGAWDSEGRSRVPSGRRSDWSGGLFVKPLFSIKRSEKPLQSERFSHFRREFVSNEIATQPADRAEVLGLGAALGQSQALNWVRGSCTA